jgi:hypothetical protein
MKVGLIQGLWCFLEGYISSPQDPLGTISFSLATSRAKVRVSPLHPSRRSRGPSRSSSSSSYKLEKREREEERAKEEPDLSDLPQHCTFAATDSSLSNLKVLQFIIHEFFT